MHFPGKIWRTILPSKRKLRFKHKKINAIYSNCFAFLSNLLSGEAQEDTTELGSNYSNPPLHTQKTIHYYLQALYTHLTVLIFDEGRISENLEKNPCGMRKNNTSNKLSSYMTRARIEPRRIRTKILRPGDLSQNLESPRLSGRVELHIVWSYLWFMHKLNI